MSGLDLLPSSFCWEMVIPVQVENAFFCSLPRLQSTTDDLGKSPRFDRNRKISQTGDRLSYKLINVTFTWLSTSKVTECAVVYLSLWLEFLRKTMGLKNFGFKLWHRSMTITKEVFLCFFLGKVGDFNAWKMMGNGASSELLVKTSR